MILGDHIMDYVAIDIGQTILSALKPESQFLVIDTHQVQQRGVEVVDMDWVFRN